MAMLMDYKSNDKSNNKFNRKEVYTLNSLPYKENRDGVGVCYIKFLLDSVFIKSFVVPKIVNGSFVKEAITMTDFNGNKVETYQLKGTKIHIKAYESNKYLDALSFNNSVFKNAVLKYLRNTENPDLLAVANVLNSINNSEDFLHNFWFSKTGTVNKDLKGKVYQLVPELYQVLKNIYDTDGGVSCLCNVIPNYVSDDGEIYSDPNYIIKDTDKSREVESFYKKYNSETGCIDVESKKVTIHELTKSGNIDNDLLRTPVRLFTFKMNHYKKMTEALDAQMEFIDEACGLDTNTNSFIVGIKNIRNGKDSYPFTVVTTKKVDLSETEKNLLRWPVEEGLNHADDVIEKNLIEWGYRDTSFLMQEVQNNPNVSFQKSLEDSTSDFESNNQLSNIEDDII